MRKEDFFEVLGELDSDIVNKAKTPIKKKMDWKKWTAMAACLALMCVAALYFVNPYQDGVTAPNPADLPPMVYVNDTLYIQSSDERSYSMPKDEFVYLGEIESTTHETSAPVQNFQSNSTIVGCEVYQYGEDIVVLINGSYWLYTKSQ